MPQLQLLPEAPSFGSQLGQQLGAGLGQGFSAGLQQQLAQFNQQKQANQQGAALAEAVGKKELAPLFGKLGPDLSKFLVQEMGAENLADSLSQIQGMAQRGSSSARAEQPLVPENMNIQEQKTITPEGISEGITENIPNQFLSDQDFKKLYEKTPSKQKPQVLKAYQEQNKLKEEQKKIGLKDTSKIRQEYANEGKSAQKSIESKERMLKLIEKGDLSNPLVAGIANYLPKGVRESILSNDSLSYESALFDEFGVLKGMFPGQIRTAEITLLEPKLASLYKNDEAKKQILSQGIEAAKVGLIKSQKAAEIEKEMPWLTTSQFEQEVNKRSQPEIDKVGSDILKNLNNIADKYSDIEMMIDRTGKLRKVNKKEVSKALDAGYKIAS